LALNLATMLDHDEFICFDRVATIFCIDSARRIVVGIFSYQW
jgi:hypothetical protein